MKKLLIVLLALTLVVTLSVTAFGLTTPSVVKGHGVVSGMLTTGSGNSSFVIGAEFGVIKDLAVGASIGNDITKVYGKYELNPSVALVGGVISAASTTNPFLGVNGGMNINRDLAVLGELDACSISGQFVFLYELGAKYNITKQLDIRGGLMGGFGNGYSSDISLELGVGFKF